MLGDKERSGAYASEQRRLVRAVVAAEVLTFNSYWRDAAAEAGLHRPRSAEDLQALPPRRLAAVGPADALVMRPSPKVVRKAGPRPLRRRLRRAGLRRGKAAAAVQVLDPLYKAIHWMIDDETPIGSTEADLVRLAELGRRSLDVAGITPSDAIVGLVPPGPNLAAWQLALGAREASVPLAGLAPSASFEAVSLLGPTVLAGRPADLLRVLAGLSEPVRSSIHTLLTVTRSPLLPDERSALSAGVDGRAQVFELWSPPGVRALWSQCRDGEGVHTWPQAELVEVCGPGGEPMPVGDEGELIWTGLGWRGTVLLRLATGVRGRLVEGRCPTCGRTTPRILDAYSTVRDRPAEVDGGASVALDPPKSTGGIESVRTVRPVRKRAAARAAREEAVPQIRGLDDPAPDAGADDERGAAVRAAAKEEPPGTVRAEAKTEADAPADSLPQPVTARSEIGDVGDLPPVPEVGPDAGGEAPAGLPHDPWLPDTGEVDAWPAPVLASTDGLKAWQVEHRRRRGHDELVVHMALAEGAELGEVLVSLERSIGATQYVVAEEADIEARVAAADGRRVVDRRSRRRSNGNGSARRVASVGRSAREG